MALEEKNLFECIKGKDLIITDNFYKLKGDYIHNKNFFSFNEYEMLKDINDAQTNNLSNIILSHKDKASNFIDCPFTNKDNQNKITTLKTTLSFGYSGQNVNNAFFIGMKKNSSELKVTRGQNSNYIYIFDLVAIDDNKCQIKYNNEPIKIEDKVEFVYHVNDNIINLYSPVSNSDSIPRILTFDISTGTISFKDINSLSENHNFYQNIYIEKGTLAEYTLDSSWVSYEQNDDINQINNNRSYFSLDNQFILHHEYSTSNSANIIPLKNNFTYKNEISNGETSIYNSNGIYLQNVPVDFKEYVSLSTGFNQEYGYDNIILNFTFNEQTYTINAGDDLIFTIPDNENDAFETNSIYPFKQLNINDTPFIRNGAFGSDSPILADKIKYYSSSTNPNDDNESVRYLCSWLYYNEERNESVWLDRYYYPVITRKDAEGKLCNLIDLSLKNDTNFKNNIITHTVYDKKSDITIKGGGTYKYCRISDEDVNNIFKKLATSRIENKTSNKGEISTIYNEILLDGENWYKVQDDKLLDTNVIHINTDIYLNPEKKMGIQLFGCDMTHGFNIQNRRDLTPFYHYADENSVYLYNNSNKLCKSINLYKIYDSPIKKVVGDIAFKNLFVLLENAFVILHYDLSIKLYQKYEFNEFEIYNQKYYIVHESDLYILKNDNSILKISYSIDDNSLYKNIILNASNSEYNSIYFDETSNNIYPFKENISKIASDKNTIFAITEDNKEKFKYILRAHDLSSGESANYFKSTTSIDNIAIGPNDEILLIRGFKEYKNTSKKWLEVYDKSRNKIYSYSLSMYDKVESVVFYRYIDLNGIEHNTFKLLCHRNDFVDIILYHIDEQRISYNITNLKSGNICNFITNDNNVIKYTNENALYFNLYMYDIPIANLRWDISSIQSGWYNIDALIDFNKSEFKIKINDDIISENLVTHFRNIKELDSNSFFDNVYLIGSIAKSHGLTLSELLYNGKKDPYSFKNTKLRNLTIYNRKLNYHEQQASLLYFKKINPIILTLPCGIRNGIEEITRYFKFNSPGSVSNKIKINIAGLDDIDLKRDTNILKSQIVDIIQKEADCLIEVENIEFI